MLTQSPQTAVAVGPPPPRVPLTLPSPRGWDELGPQLPLPPQLKKRALDQLRLVKPKHAGSPAGSPAADSPEQLLLEPCAGEAGCEGVTCAARRVRSVHVRVAFGLEGPVVRTAGGRGASGGLREEAPLVGDEPQGQGSGWRRRRCANAIVGL